MYTIWLNYLPLVWFASTLCAPDNGEKPCTYHDGGNFYDLNPLTASTDYEFKTPGGHDLILNVCKSVSHETWNIKVPNPEEVGGFIRKDHGDFSVGVVNTSLTVETGEPMLLLSDGSQCANTENKASTVIQFICDTSVFAAGKPQLVAQLPKEDDLACAFLIEWRTHYACPASEMGGASGVLVVLLITIIVLVMLYTVSGTLYNRFILRRRGFDQLPGYSLTAFKEYASVVGKWVVEKTNFYGTAQGLNPNSHQWSISGGGGMGSGLRVGARIGGDRIPLRSEEPRRFQREAGPGDEEEAALVAEENSRPSPPDG